MVGVGAVVGVGLVGTVQALVRWVRVVMVRCAPAPAVGVVGVPELVQVEVLHPKHIIGLSFSFSLFTSHFQLL